MEKEILQKYIDLHYSTYKIAAELNCSQTNIRHWLRKYGINTDHSYSHESCQVCSSPLQGKRKKFCSTQCKNQSPVHKKSSYKKQKERGLKNKRRLVVMKGGECEWCGYNKCLAALCFHHIFPKNKTFNIDIRKCSNTRWESLLKEADKCKLLCSNCHFEYHYG